MIYTLTVNPSIDYVADVDNFKTGIVNRTTSENVFAGGKGINVSIVLKNLGVETTALGFVAGFTGDKITSLLKEKGLATDFIQLKNGMSRINVKLHSDDETEINGTGPSISREEVDLLFKKLDKLNENDTLVLAGSIPTSLPQTFYSDIMNHIATTLKDKKIRVVVDATKKLLLNVLKYKPFLVKPNNIELGELFDVEITTKEDVAKYAKQLQQMGAQNVLVSMAGDGAVLAASDGSIYTSEAPKITVVNSVGAGDSMVAGFIAGYELTSSYKDALKYGIASGSASASHKDLATCDQIKSLLAQL